MAYAQDESSSLRFGRRESVRVAAALLASLLVHLSIWGGYHIGHKMGWWQKLHPPAWLRLEPKKKPLPAQTARDEEPTIFVDVSHADTEAPAKAKYYSDKNSRAANPVEANANVPVITGKQKDVPKTEDVPKLVKKDETSPKPDNSSPFNKLQPSPPKPAQTEATETPQKPGETDLLKPKKETTTPTQLERPRTLNQALAMRHQLPGERMQQDGGVSRHAQHTAMDVKATPFGEYDRAIIEAVTQRWYDLLDQHRYADDRTGKVTLRFKLLSDGTVIEMQTEDNTVGDFLGYLCQESIEQAAPFGKWPPDMVRMIGANSRDITFTFYYY